MSDARVDKTVFILTHRQQREKHAASRMTSIQLEAHLCLIMDRMIEWASEGVIPTGLLAQFQQDLHYAPPEMKLKLLDRVDRVKNNDSRSIN